MAVLAQRLQPTSALLDALDDGWPRDLREALGSNEGGPTDEVLLWMYPMLVLYIGLMCTAWTLDQRTRYTTTVPHWAQAGALGFPLWRQFLFHARTQMVLLRPFHVVPDRTAYTTVRTSPLSITHSCSPCTHAQLGHPRCSPIYSACRSISPTRCRAYTRVSSQPH